MTRAAEERVAFTKDRVTRCRARQNARREVGVAEPQTQGHAGRTLAGDLHTSGPRQPDVEVLRAERIEAEGSSRDDVSEAVREPRHFDRADTIGNLLHDADVE